MSRFNIIIKALLLALLITIASTRDVKFSLISFGKVVEVNIGSEKYSLTSIKNTILYQTEITVDDDVVSYYYIVDGIKEDFTRTLAEGEITTHNEFFNRKYTVKPLPQFPTVFEWTKSVGKGELFDDSYIPTVHITGVKSEKTFTSTSADSEYLESVLFILKDNYYIFKNVPCYPKNKKWNKFQFKVELGKDGIEGRYLLKFRDNNEDPTFMRQDLYGDILNALGYPTIQSVKTRVYVNGRAVGYYILQEEAASESFVRSAFHGDNKGNYLITDVEELGHAFDCSTGADFYYTGNDFYSFKVTNPDRYDRSRLVALAKAFEELDVSNMDAVEKFDKEWFDIDSFFKAIAMEYLTAHWDSYWFYSTNFAVYQDPTQSTKDTFKFYFICQDWDGTFGLNAGSTYLRFSDYINHSYKDYVNVEWGIDEYDSPRRYAIDKLLSNKTLKARFETILTTIVTKIFNPVVIGKRLDALVERHREEVAWNYQSCNDYPIRKGKGEQLNWTIKDFDKNINEPTSHGASYGIKQFVYLRAKAVKEEFGLDLDLGDSSEFDSSSISYNGLCGPDNGKCPNGQCCSQYGYCGTSSKHCGVGCQTAFGKCDISEPVSTPEPTTIISQPIPTITQNTPSIDNISTNGRCGAEYGRCPDGQCCSKYGYCGIAKAHCDLGCQPQFGQCQLTDNIPVATTTVMDSTIPTDIPISTNGRCGSVYGKCPEGLCCSKYGYCGITTDHCASGCQITFGICN